MVKAQRKDLNCSDHGSESAKTNYYASWHFEAFFFRNSQRFSWNDKHARWREKVDKGPNNWVIKGMHIVGGRHFDNGLTCHIEDAKYLHNYDWLIASRIFILQAIVIRIWVISFFDLVLAR